MSREVSIVENVLRVNDELAGMIRRELSTRKIFTVNLIGAPGCGKTALLERTLEAYDASRRVAVLTGDIQTDADAARLARYGFPVRQITTAGACHLDARMVRTGLEGWPMDSLDVLFLENVGNLVCPTSYDLGEAKKIVLLSVTEGDEKPLKYPGIFFKSELMLLTKIDLLPYVPFQLDVAIANARSIHPDIEVLQLSCQTKAGIGQWIEWIERQCCSAGRER
jgi:hydrogenase nickel incorporation protein HypB